MYIYVYTYVNTYICIYNRYTYTGIYIYMYIYIYTYVCTYMYIYIYTHIRIHVCVNSDTNAPCQTITSVAVSRRQNEIKPKATRNSILSSGDQIKPHPINTSDSKVKIDVTELKRYPHKLTHASMSTHRCVLDMCRSTLQYS